MFIMLPEGQLRVFCVLLLFVQSVFLFHTSMSRFIFKAILALLDTDFGFLFIATLKELLKASFVCVYRDMLMVYNIRDGLSYMCALDGPHAVMIYITFDRILRVYFARVFPFLLIVWKFVDANWKKYGGECVCV